MTAGGQVREQELMASLQMLLEKVEKGQLTLGPGKDNMWSRYFPPGRERRVEILSVP